MGGAIIVGVILRAHHYWADRPLWLDEAMLGVNVVRRSFAGLWRAPLEYGQVAPFGYLALERTAYLAGGDVELALRIPAFIAGVLALGVIAWLAVRLLPPWPAALAVVLAALNPSLIFYSSQAKPYSLDVALAGMALLVGLRIQERPPDRQTAMRWGAILGSLTWFSAPLAFVGVGVGVATRQFGFLAVWAVAAVPALLHMRTYAQRSPDLGWFWESGYLPWSLDWSPWVWLLRLPGRLMASPLHWDAYEVTVAAGIAVLGIGVWASWQSERRRLLLVPVAVALVAASAHIYPLGAEGVRAGGRIVLYMVPSLVLMAALGAARLWRAHWFVGACVVGLVSVGAAMGLASAPYNFSRNDMPSVLFYVRRHWQPGDRLYVHFAANAESQFYQKIGPDPQGIIWPYSRWESLDACCQLADTIPPGRAWMLYSYRQGAAVQAWEPREQRRLRQRGEQIDSVVGGHTIARLYELR